MLTATTESLASLTAVHNWLSERLPLGQTLASTRLFIALGNAQSKGLPVHRKTLEDRNVLPRGRPGADLLAAYVQAGLLTKRAMGPHPDQLELLATERLHALMAAYEGFYNGMWVLRDRYRRHLHVQGLDVGAAKRVRQLFDEFLDCDYLHGYGSGCVRVSYLLVEALRLKGEAARAVPCWASLAESGRGDDFALGKASAQVLPGQVDAHVVCVWNDEVLLDFGLGVARRCYSGLVPWAVAVPVHRATDDPVMTHAHTEAGLSIEWHRRGFGEAVFDEMARVAQEVPGLLEPYRARAGATPA